MDEQIKELEYKTRHYVSPSHNSGQGSGSPAGSQGLVSRSLSGSFKAPFLYLDKRYLLLPLVIFMTLLIEPPWFVRSDAETDDGERVSVISYKSVLFYTILFSLLCMALYLYIRK